MLFNSLQFLIFFPTVAVLYYVLPHRFRWMLLLIASCVFYMVLIPQYILILFVLIAIDYNAAIWIEQGAAKDKKRFLWLSIVATCVALLIFKYLNFFLGNVEAIAHLLGISYAVPALKIILPIGLSFHTFQSLSYVIEVYRGRQKAERHPGIYSLYVLFFPQLVAGPIERPGNLLHQFYEVHEFDHQRVTDGLKLMLWGFFKKIVIADRLGIMVDHIYGNARNSGELELLLATFFFAVQIYCDFSGYSEIAIGAARVMGFKLMTNFRRPYLASSLKEFWERWHISLSTWFRDYLYIPLGGSRVNVWLYVRNILITFLVSGLWHGANMTFVVWGALHGVGLLVASFFRYIRSLVVVDLTNPFWKASGRCVSTGVTFSFVCLAWVFFRAKTLEDAFFILNSLSQGIGRCLLALAHLDFGMVSFTKKIAIFSSPWEWPLTFGLIIFLVACEALQEWQDSAVRFFYGLPAVFRYASYYALLAAICFWGVLGEKQFIYFQF